jgi:UDP-glucose 6-dehydrogenase
MSKVINYHIGIIGIGVLGTAISETLLEKNNILDKNKTYNLHIRSYDKYKNIGCLEDLLTTDFIFLCLPTEYSKIAGEYEKTEIFNVCSQLSHLEYKGIVIIKSTIEPTTTESIYNKYSNLQLIHNPEFLTARTATHDFANQSHIILGVLPSTRFDNIEFIVNFYCVIFNAVLKYTKFINTNTNTNTNTNNINTDTDNKDINKNESNNNTNDNCPIISICSSTESESVKIFCNSFYATKIQFFTEIKLLCNKLNIDYDIVKNMMLLNGWINEMHTQIPGHDGQVSFGGKCFPKDISALCSFMTKLSIPNKVINAVVIENNEMRPT